MPKAWPCSKGAKGFYLCFVYPAPLVRLTFPCVHGDEAVKSVVRLRLLAALSCHPSLPICFSALTVPRTYVCDCTLVDFKFFFNLYSLSSLRLQVLLIPTCTLDILESPELFQLSINMNEIFNKLRN